MPVLAASARDGRIALEPLLELSSQSRGQPDYGLLVRESEQLAVGLLTWPLIVAPDDGRASLQPFVTPLLAAAACVRDGVAKVIALPELPNAMDAATRPIIMEVARATAAIANAVSPGAAVAASPASSRATLFSIKNWKA